MWSSLLLCFLRIILLACMCAFLFYISIIMYSRSRTYSLHGTHGESRRESPSGLFSSRVRWQRARRKREQNIENHLLKRILFLYMYSVFYIVQLLCHSHIHAFTRCNMSLNVMCMYFYIYLAHVQVIIHMLCYDYECSFFILLIVCTSQAMHTIMHVYMMYIYKHTHVNNGYINS